MSESILVVEDNQALGETLVSYLSEKGFSATHFLNGEDALLYLEINSSDLIICDIMLPGISGIQFLKIINLRNISLKSKPLIVHFLLTLYTIVSTFS